MIHCIPVCLIQLTSLCIQAHVTFPVTHGSLNEEYCFIIDPNQPKVFDYPGVRHTIERFLIIDPRHAYSYFFFHLLHACNTCFWHYYPIFGSFDPQQHVFFSLGIRFSLSLKFCILFSHYLCNEFLCYKHTSHRTIILWSFSAFFVWNKHCYSCYQSILYFLFFLRLLKSAAQYLCVTVSCLSQKFDICSLLGAYKLSYCFSAIVTFFMSWIPCHTKIFWNWSWSSRHLHYLWSFSHIFLSDLLYLSCGWCIFRISIFKPENT
jgi:hypothetical protein